MGKIISFSYKLFSSIESTALASLGGDNDTKRAAFNDTLGDNVARQKFTP